MHYEVELALIMGKTVRDLKESNAQGALEAIESEQCPQIFLSCICVNHDQAMQSAST